MKSKIVSILVCMLLITTTFIINYNEDSNVKADPGGGGEGSDGIGLDFEYMWDITENLSNVVHQYPSGMIPKGRAFGNHETGKRPRR